MIPANIHASSSGTLSRLLETHQSTSSSRNRSSPICNHIFLIPFFIFLWLACLFSCHARFEIPTGAQRAWLRLPPFQLVTLFPFLLGCLFSCLEYLQSRYTGPSSHEYLLSGCDSVCLGIHLAVCMHLYSPLATFVQFLITPIDFTSIASRFTRF